LEYIEVASNNKMIDSNKIIDTKLTAEGIVVNLTGSASQPRAIRTTTTVDHNNITGCLSAITIEGQYTANVNVVNNTITNPKVFGIDVNNFATTYTVAVSNNIINITQPNLVARTAITSYVTTLQPTQRLSLNNNNITYTTSAANGKAAECAFLPGTNNTVLTGNKVTGNNIKSGGIFVMAITSNGNYYTGYSFTNNMFTGSSIDISGFKTVSKSGNNF
jgi:hypothetical protein